MKAIKKNSTEFIWLSKQKRRKGFLILRLILTQTSLCQLEISTLMAYRNRAVALS